MSSRQQGFLSTRCILLLGEQGQYVIRSLPDTFMRPLESFVCDGHNYVFKSHDNINATVGIAGYIVN